jgi:hypothetical protein
VHLRQKNFAAAQADALEAVKAEPDNVKARFRAGTAAAGQGEWAVALAQLGAALKLAPGDAAVRAECVRVKEAAAASKKALNSAWGGMFKKATGGGLYGDVKAAGGGGGGHAVEEDDLDEAKDEEDAKVEEEEAKAEAGGAQETLDE